MSESQIHDPDEVNGPEDISFPGHMHHFKVRSELTSLVEDGAISNDEADEAYENWKDSR